MNIAIINYAAFGSIYPNNNWVLIVIKNNIYIRFKAETFNMLPLQKNSRK